MGRMFQPRTGDAIRTVTVDTFGGYNHRVQTRDGAIWDEKNMCGEAYPAARSRPERRSVQLWGNANSLRQISEAYAWDDTLYLLAFTLSQDPCTVTLYSFDPASDSDPVSLGTWQTLDFISDRNFASIGPRLAIFPDGMIYDRDTGQIEEMNAVLTVPADEVEFSTFTPTKSIYAGQVNSTLRIKISKKDRFPFRAGDTVKIRVTDESFKPNEVTATVREVVRNSGFSYLVFYENTFSVTGEPAGTVTVERTAHIDNAVECDGRLWGYSGNYIYASALNDPFNWYRFDGLSTDSFVVEAPGGGEITGVISYLGAPYFFKETGIIRIYGSEPSEYVASMTECVGVRAGNARSLALVGGALYYNSKAGIMRYTGSTPALVSHAFGGKAYRYAVAGSDGLRYYVRLMDEQDGGTGNVWQYDPSLGEWFRFDTASYKSMTYNGTLWALDTYGVLSVLGASSADIASWRLTDEAGFTSSVIFANIEGTYTSASRQYYGRKALSRIDLRMTLEAGVTAKVWILYDAAQNDVRDVDKDWTLLSTVRAQSAQCRTVRVPVIPRRCDHFALRITTDGQWMLHSMTVMKHQGTDLH